MTLQLISSHTKREQLLDAFVSGESVVYIGQRVSATRIHVDPKTEGTSGVIHSITREDGGGLNFLIEVNTGPKMRVIFMRTRK